MTTIRPAEPADAEEVHELHRASVRTFGAAAYDEPAVEAWASHDVEAARAAIEDDDHRFVVAERDGELAGFGDLHLAESEVTAVYAHPDHAGRGVGSALLSRLEAEARDRELETLGLLASRNAVGFYAGAGYERVETRVHETAGVELECVWMEKQLR